MITQGVVGNMEQLIEVRCGDCGARMNYRSKSEIVAFEASHREEHGEETAFQYSGRLEDFPVR